MREHAMTPTIVDMKVIPVAGHNSMLLSLLGAYEPFFTRTIVILTDSTGNVGLGETQFSKTLTDALVSCTPLILGTHLGEYKNTLLRIGEFLPKPNRVRRMASIESHMDLSVQAAFEAPFLDLLGQYMSVPAAALLGAGMQRKHVPVQGYLFFIGDRNKTDLPYIGSSDENAWYRLRREAALTPDKLVAMAIAAREKYGFRDFKIKGGVLEGSQEIQAVWLLKAVFPDSRITLDPNACWSLDEAVSLCKGMGGILACCEDPCGAESGFSGREIMSEFRHITGMPTASNMIAQDWRQLWHTIALQSLDIPLADPQYWTMSGAVRAGQLCHNFGLMWGNNSTCNFDISLAMLVHTAAAIPGEINACDTQWIYHEGEERLTKQPLQITKGNIAVPDKPGLGIEPDYNRIEKAHELYLAQNPGRRNDSVAMQYLLPNWEFDPHCPCLVR